MDQDTLNMIKRISERHFLDEGMRRIEMCLGQLTEEQVWSRPNQASNSVGILLTHLVGNITQYLISGLGDAPDIRRRDREFDSPPPLPKAELQRAIATTLKEAVAVLSRLTPGEVRPEYRIQGFSLSFLEVVIHVLEHFSYHVGQIAYITKMLTDRQTGFYTGVDLNAHNRPL